MRSQTQWRRRQRRAFATGGHRGWAAPAQGERKREGAAGEGDRSRRGWAAQLGRGWMGWAGQAAAVPAGWGGGWGGLDTGGRPPLCPCPCPPLPRPLSCAATLGGCPPTAQRPFASQDPRWSRQHRRCATLHVGRKGGKGGEDAQRHCPPLRTAKVGGRRRSWAAQATQRRRCCPSPVSRSIASSAVANAAAPHPPCPFPPRVGPEGRTHRPAPAPPLTPPPPSAAPDCLHPSALPCPVLSLLPLCPSFPSPPLPLS